MKDANCIFCKIAKGEMPAYKVYEDKDYVAFLDIFPNTEGQTLVMPKAHTNSKFSDVDDKELAAFMIVVKKVANLLVKKLGVERANLVFEGTEVKHLHAKLYPMKSASETHYDNKQVYFKCFPGYTTSLTGPRASDSDLRELQEKITH